MSRRDKILERLTLRPTDFAWTELEAVMEGFGYMKRMGSGSRRKFFHPETKVVLSIHQPHPGNILKHYQVRDVLKHLTEQGLL